MAIKLNFEKAASGEYLLNESDIPEPNATQAAITAIFEKIKRFDKETFERLPKFDKFTAILTVVSDKKTQVKIEFVIEAEKEKHILGVPLKPETANTLPPSLLQKLFPPTSNLDAPKPVSNEPPAASVTTHSAARFNHPLSTLPLLSTGPFFPTRGIKAPLKTGPSRINPGTHSSANSKLDDPKPVDSQKAPAALAPLKLSPFLFTMPLAMAGPSALLPHNPPKIEGPLPPGIKNPNTNCFMNATFQMIMNDKVLRDALVETYREEIKKCEIKLTEIAEKQKQLDQELQSSQTGWFYWLKGPYIRASQNIEQNKTEREKCEKLASAYQKFLDAVKDYEKGGKEIDLTPLRYLLTIFPHAKPWGMGDAEEFFNALFHPVDCAKYQIGYREGFERTYAPLNPQSEFANKYTQERWATTKVDDRVVLQEGNKSTSLTPKQTPTLSLEFEKNSTGQKLLDQLFEPSHNHDCDPTPCQNGYYLLQTEKRIFQHPPKRFMIHLKRFTDTGAKINKPLQMSEIVTIEGQHYSLKSIVYHIGAAHYIAYIKKQDTWFKANDEHVTVATHEDLETGLNYGYLYFYEKIQKNDVE